MNGRILIGVGVAIVVATGLSGVAGGAGNRFQASFNGDPNASMEFAIKLSKSGEPKRTSKVTFANVDLVCADGSTTEITGTAPGNRIRKQPDGPIFFAAGGPGTALDVNLNGYLSADGTKAHGKLFIDQKGTVPCGTGGGLDSMNPVARWAAKP